VMCVTGTLLSTAIGRLWYCNRPEGRANLGGQSQKSRRKTVMGALLVVLFVFAVFAGMTWLMD
jgi:hypothetical protein